MLASSMKFMVFPINIHGFFQTRKPCALPPSLRSFLHSFSCHRLHLRHFIKPTPSVFLKVPKIAWPNLQTMGGGNFLAFHVFSILWTSSQECHGKRTWDPSWEWYLRAIGATELAQSLAQLRFWNHILVDWIWHAPWRSCYNARLKCVCIITSHTSTKKPTLDSTVNNVLDSPSNKAFFPVFFGAKVLSHRDSVFPSTQSNAWSSDVLIQLG